MATEDRGNENSHERRAAEEEFALSKTGQDRRDDQKWEDDDSNTPRAEEQLTNPNLHYGSRGEAEGRAEAPETDGTPRAHGPFASFGASPESGDGPGRGEHGHGNDVSEGFPGHRGGENADADDRGPAAAGHGRSPRRYDRTDNEENSRDTLSPDSETGRGTPRNDAFNREEEDFGEDAEAPPPVADAALVETANVTGAEDTTIALDLSAALSDTDGSESLSVTLSGVPDGAVLNHGTDLGGGVWSVDPEDLGDLTLIPPADSDEDFTLTLNATTVDGSDSTTVSESFDVTVEPVADDAIISVSDAHGEAHNAIALDLSAALSDTDGSESLSVTVSGVPDGAVLNHGTDLGGGEWSVDPRDLGDLTLTPPDDSDWDFTLNLNATSTDGTDTATVSQGFQVTAEGCTPIMGTNSSETLNGTDGHDCILGLGGHDTINGGGGADTIVGGTGNDNLFGGEGDDTFLFGFGDGADEVYGGAGSDWTDVISLEGMGTAPGGGDWTISIGDGSIADTEPDHLVLTEDTAGTITLSDGSTIDFEGIERIEW